MADFLIYLVLFALFALAGLAGLWMLRGHLGGQSPMVALFGPKPEKRLEVVEHASIDGKRRLVLIRRDDVEHLLMTGGPVDVVIETGIGVSHRQLSTEHGEPERAEASTSTQAVFTRPARTFGRATPQVAE